MYLHSLGLLADEQVMEGCAGSQVPSKSVDR